MGEKDVKVLKTKYFDIIYPEKCEKTASLLYENADNIFNEVSGQYGLEPSFNLPIVITSTVDVYNAFYTPAPYNRIVLYDTSSSSLEDLSSSFSETFLSTFRHELTHAVTYNMKNGFWNGFSSIFGNVAVPGYFFVTSGMAEGAAVASESSNGEGRLNNEYAKHFVKQAKIEDSFPSFYKVQGSSNTNVMGDYYYFNGAFHKYLQDTYGMDKYRKLWEAVINMKRPGFNWSFHSVYKTSVRKEWKKFIDSYNVPKNIIKDVIKEKASKDFFNPLLDDYSMENKSGSRFSSLCVTDKGLYYAKDYPLYKNSKEIIFVSKEELNKEDKIKGTSLFTKQLLDKASPSSDGRFIALSTMSTLDSNITSITEIYDSINNSFYKVKEDGLKDSSIIKDGNDYYLVSQKYNSPNVNLIIKKIEIENNKIKEVKDFYKEEFPINSFIASFIDINDGRFIYILKERSKYSLCIRNIKNNTVEKVYTLPPNIMIKDLSYNNGNVLFSYVTKDSMPRLGVLDINKDKIYYSTVDLSGGIFNPILIEDKIVYRGSFYKEDRLLTLEKDSVVLKDIKISEATKENYSDLINNESSSIVIEESNKEKAIDISEFSTDYKWYKNSYKGIIVPISLYTSNLFGLNLGKNSVSQNLLYGLTYATSNPWSNGTDDLLLVTLGYGYLSSSFGIEAQIIGGTSTSLFNYNVDVKTEFDRFGWKQSGANINLGSGFNFGKTSSFSIGENISVMGGRYNNCNYLYNDFDSLTFWNTKLFESALPLDDKAFNISILSSITYSNVHMKGSGIFERSGLKVNLKTGFIYDSYYKDDILINLNFNYYVPHLIPIPEKRDLTYNLPLIMNLSIMPQASDYGLTRMNRQTAGSGVIDGNIHTVLFGWDIQNVVPFMEVLYFQKLYLTCGYDFTIASYKGTKKGYQFLYFFDYLNNLSNGQSAYLDSFYLQLSCDITANIGVLAMGSNVIKLIGRFTVPLHTIENYSKSPFFSVGLSATF